MAGLLTLVRRFGCSNARVCLSKSSVVIKLHTKCKLENPTQKRSSISVQELIVKRAVLEFRPHMIVNLDVGLPPFRVPTHLNLTFLQLANEIVQNRDDKHQQLTLLQPLQVSHRGDVAHGETGRVLQRRANTRVIALMEHTGEDGLPKILKSCDLPLTGVSCVDMIITEKCVFRVDKDNGLELIELAKQTDMLEIMECTGCEFVVNEKLIVKRNLVA